jgi:copper chaperone CopZ
MEHTYSLSGMTCSGCEAEVQKAISKIPGVSAVKANSIEKTVVVEMDRHIGTDELADSLKDYPKYDLTNFHPPTDSNIVHPFGNGLGTIMDEPFYGRVFPDLFFF